MVSCLLRSEDQRELRLASKKLTQQDGRIDRLHDKLEATGDFLADIRHDVSDMMDVIEHFREIAGQQKAKENIARATSAVLDLANTFDMLDVNDSGAIDIAELRRGLHQLGLESHSAAANAIIDRYTHEEQIDIKVFSTLVRDIHLLLTFDRDGSGTLDAHELKGALRQLGLECSDLSVAKIVRAWDADASGKLDLLEFTDLVRSLRAFNKYDKDASGDIDIDELRPALRRLGFPADTATANAILKWYDHDESGRIELYEFAIMARDVWPHGSTDRSWPSAYEPPPSLSGRVVSSVLPPVSCSLGSLFTGSLCADCLCADCLCAACAALWQMSVFTAYDEDHTGTLDATKLRPALAKLGLAASEAEVRRTIHVSRLFPPHSPLPLRRSSYGRSGASSTCGTTTNRA
jgi:centrin-1